MIGTTLAHFKITAKLGEGGMGVVYRAEDTVLGRDVALKLLPRQLASDAERLARFEREARVLAALEHPGIASIYSFESATPAVSTEEESIHFLVMQLAEGENLAQRITRGRLTVETATAIVQQLIEAFEFAHGKGIVHRDLKPANVMIDAEGRIMVLDFGLAKALTASTETSGPGGSSATGEEPMSRSPTMTADMTSRGVLMGTASYMSPEQVRGKPADRRSDIWALGCVWFEMLTGQKVFGGETVSDSIAGILEREPRWDDLPREFPGAHRRLLRRCLAKDPRERFHDVADVRLALADSGDAETGRGDSGRRPTSRKWFGVWLAAAVSLGLLAGHIITLENLTPTVEQGGPPVRLSVDLGEGNSLSFRTASMGSQEIVARPFAVSPDGRTLVVALDLGSGSRLYTRPFHQAGLQPIPGTEGGNSPFFSPDGRWIGFLTTSGQLKKTLVERGTPITLCDVRSIPQFLVGPGFAWTPDDRIVFSLGGTSGLFVISAEGGTPEPLTRLDGELEELSHVWPRLLPDGKTVLYTEINDPGKGETSRIAAVSLVTGERTLIFEGGADAHLLPGGNLVFLRQETLVAARFDEERLKIVGSPIAVSPRVRSLLGALSIVVSGAGDLIFLAGGPDATGSIVWVDRQGGTTPASPEPLELAFSHVRLSPDGGRVVTDLEDGIWILDLERGTRTRLVDHDGVFADWTMDGAHVMYASTQGRQELFLRSVNNPEDERQLTDKPGVVASAPVPSPDGKLVAYYEIHPENARDIWLLALDGEREPWPFQATPANERSPAFSPDGQWLLYSSDDSGREEVYARRLDREGRTWQISNNGGVEPVWSRDGSEIFYRSWNKMMVVPVDLGTELEVGNPRRLWEGHFAMLGFTPAYDVDSSGERFLMIRNRKTEPVRHLQVVLNWADEVARAIAD